jgi:hypothetical protein
MTTGSRVVCTDDVFLPEVAACYIKLPVKGRCYTIRNMCVGVNWKNEPGEVCVHLAEIVNPRSSTPPFPERGFNAERFRDIEEKTETNTEHEPELVSITGDNETR